MTYVISDLHGYRIEKLKELLEKTNFSEDDRLYILGDVIDRNGDGGIGVLQWLIKQPNAELIMGNHEAMLLACDFIFENVTDAFLEDFDEKKNRLLRFVIRMWVSMTKVLSFPLRRKSLGYTSADIRWMMWLRAGAGMSRR